MVWEVAGERREYPYQKVVKEAQPLAQFITSATFFFEMPAKPRQDASPPHKLFAPHPIFAILQDVTPDITCFIDWTRHSWLVDQ